ncbi:MAG TPA: BlaI/MecI/CopY family transcriptional regulator [Fimbriimonadaceae bacterium]|nr:BlaI/MecI/CopY family transcriptional regulator [Fimbriimonadaceae bacterium]
MKRTKKKDLSTLEMSLMRHFAEAGPQTVREAAEGFGEQRGYARTTVLTLMERLRQKGYLAREKRDGVYHYSPQIASGDLDRGAVKRFVQRALGGSVSPLVAFLAENPDLTEDEVAELRKIVEKMEGRGHK